ncbi:MAG: hypothetical protein MUF15_05865 [Acidobacteria bacterium]|jgi:hypothetical protein|nr:hypothetical protein [Acidobacteriota bacterium]
MRGWNKRWRTISKLSSWLAGRQENQNLPVPLFFPKTKTNARETREKHERVDGGI